MDPLDGKKVNRSRDYVLPPSDNTYDLLQEAVWTRRFIRNVEVMKGAAHGAISPTPTLASRTMGETYEEFIANLYMPEELLRNRNKYEKKVYRHEPSRPPGTGDIEKFRKFVLKSIKKPTKEFWKFHAAVSQNSADAIRRCQRTCKNKEIQGRYCQMLCMEFFGAQHRSRFADWFDVFIIPAFKARFGKVLVPDAGIHLASVGG